MASIIKQPNGRRVIQFKGADKRRRSIRLGKVSQRTAETIRPHVEHLAAAASTGHAMPDATANWLEEIGDDLRDKLAAAKLVSRRESATLAAFVDRYIESRGDWKPGTRTAYKHTRRCLVEHFGADKPLRDITTGDARDWRRWLLSDQKLAENTTRRRCGIARQYFDEAHKRRLIRENPFVDRQLPVGMRRVDKRRYFVTQDDAARVLDTCPDAQWRLIFALSRYAGVRCPSETLSLRWEDVDWEHDRFTVHSPKTEHIEGHETRLVPIFPELLPHLRDAFEEAEPGAVYAVTRYRDATQNLRTQLTKIIRRAGLTPWPKLFHNLRSTRETELMERFPAHVVFGWIGNSEKIATKHYLQTTEAHFERAATEAVQKAVQQVAETMRDCEATRRR